MLAHFIILLLKGGSSELCLSLVDFLLPVVKVCLKSGVQIHESTFYIN